MIGTPGENHGSVFAHLDSPTQQYCPQTWHGNEQVAVDMSNYGPFGSFELNSMLRGAQLTLVGAQRALQNPGLFTSNHYRQVAYAILAGVVIRIALAIPVGLACVLDDCVEALC